MAFLEEWYAHEILWVGRAVGVESECAEDIPAAHLACIVHAGIRQSLRPHAIVVVEELVEDVLALGLSVDEVVGEGNGVVGLVAVASSNFLHLVLSRTCELISSRDGRLKTTFTIRFSTIHSGSGKENGVVIVNVDRMSQTTHYDAFTYESPEIYNR